MKRQLELVKAVVFGDRYRSKIRSFGKLGWSGFRRNLWLLLPMSALLVSSVILLRGQEHGSSPQEFNLTMVGDAEVVTPAMARQNNPRFMAVANAVRKGDAAFANVEEPYPTSNRAYPAGLPRAQWHTTSPTMLKQLQWMGFNLFRAANNHSRDFGIQGLLETMQVYKQGSAQESVKVCNWRGFQNPGASGFRG